MNSSKNTIFSMLSGELSKTALIGCALLSLGVVSAADAKTTSGVRTIHLKQDDAQVRFESKIYQLKYTKAEELLPFINSAILRYNALSSVKRVTNANAKAAEQLIVTTGKDFLPYVDKIVAALDRQGKKNAKSTITGTGISSVVYNPQYRAASEFADIIALTLGSSSSSAHVNPETNTIFWRDQTASAKRTLNWVEKLDRPIPQVSVRLNYYELRDSDLKDWGFDYLAWKNGPGVNLLNVAYSAGRMATDEVIDGVQAISGLSWNNSGFFAAPQIDLSFIRCLQQSGNASVASHGQITLVNTPVHTVEQYQALQQYQVKNPKTAPFIYSISMTPEYQNIAKNALGRTFVGKSFYEDVNGVKHNDPPALEATIVNPFICFSNPNGYFPKNAKAAALKNGGVIFSYSLYFKNVVERGNTGSELSNSVQFTGATTLGFNSEKVLAVYEKENDVKQTIGIPVLCRIPVLKYLFSTVTTIKERTYIVVTAEATPINAHAVVAPQSVSASEKIERRVEKPFSKKESK